MKMMKTAKRTTKRRREEEEEDVLNGIVAEDVTGFSAIDSE